MSVLNDFQELYDLLKKYGWTGAAYTREDVESIYRDLTDAEWETLRNSREWLNLFDNDQIANLIWDHIADMCYDLFGITAPCGCMTERDPLTGKERVVTHSANCPEVVNPQ